MVPGITGRIPRYSGSLYACLEAQIGDNRDVELIALLDNRNCMSIGEKMNWLVKMARGEYVCTVGDDDQVTDDYVELILRAIDEEPKVDVITFDHAYYQDGEFRARIEEGLGLKKWESYELQHFTRSPSNKMPMRRELVTDFTYPHQWHGEDWAFARWVHPKLQSQRRIPKTLYRYFYRTDNPEGKHFRRLREKGY